MSDKKFSKNYKFILNPENLSELQSDSMYDVVPSKSPEMLEKLQEKIRNSIYSDIFEFSYEPVVKMINADKPETP